MNSTNQNLIISPEDYERGYNYNFVPWVKQDYNGSDYITWSNAFIIFKKLFPTYAVEMHKVEKLESDIDSEYLKSYHEDLCRQAEEATDHKTAKKIRNKANKISERISYRNAGMLLYPRIVDLNTNLASPTIQLSLIH
ncbi:MAG: hypothetical protein AB4372_10615, partial [Xenococcus sp. (in: cyanobacteria)]